MTTQYWTVGLPELGSKDQVHTSQRDAITAHLDKLRPNIPDYVMVFRWEPSGIASFDIASHFLLDARKWVKENRPSWLRKE